MPEAPSGSPAAIPGAAVLEANNSGDGSYNGKIADALASLMQSRSGSRSVLSPPHAEAADNLGEATPSQAPKGRFGGRKSNGVNYRQSNLSEHLWTDETCGTHFLALEINDRQELVDDYAAGMYQPKVPTTLQACLRKFSVSYTWLLVQVAATSTDLANIFFAIRDPALNERFLALLLVTSALYIVDVLMRMLAMGSCEFLMKWWNRLDIIIIYICTVGAILQTSSSHIRIFRVFRISMVLNRKLRHITGQNKQRFLSLENDLDIDLAYVTPQLIAMSVPAEDYITRLYRNDIKDVVRFFHLFHRAHFHICNLCPELPYNPAYFGTNPRTNRPNVDHFNIQDHTPPLMDDFLRFFKIARSWMTEDPENNVIAVHCRGGKGRTGSLCCAWLLYSGDAEHAQDALNIFALARTDINKIAFLRQQKLQGVETPSQVRYVRYIDTLLRNGPYRFPDAVLPPKISRLKLQKLIISDLLVSPKQGKKLVAAVHVPFTNNKENKESQAAWKIIYWSPEVEASEFMEFDLGNLIVSKDTRITVFKAEMKAKVHAIEGTHVLAGNEPGCLFYFLFHTFFHSGTAELEIAKCEIDKAWKSSKYKDGGSLKLQFQHAPHLQQAARRVRTSQRMLNRARGNTLEQEAEATQTIDV